MKNAFFVILGVISLGLGLLGIALPLLPTTPFVLLSAALFMRSSPRLYAWLLSHRVLGEYLRNYYENKTVPLRVKLTSITILWISILYSTFFFAKDLLWLQILLIIICVLVTLHIARLGRNS